MDWHQRYTQQALWTREIRSYLLQKIGISSEKRVLEIGCGTGAILAEMSEWRYHSHSPANDQFPSLIGLDINQPYLFEARRNAPHSHLVLGDAHALPFPGSSFYLVYCHFLLLWLKDPSIALREMKRVAGPGGWVAAFAEPDYGGRLDYPDQLAELGKAQSASLVQQGADPDLGRKLRMFFSRVGFVNIESGILGARWVDPQLSDEQDIEWDVIEQDLQGYPINEELSSLKQIDRKARACGERVLFVPTFYAVGQVEAEPISSAPQL